LKHFQETGIGPFISDRNVVAVAEQSVARYFQRGRARFFEQKAVSTQCCLVAGNTGKPPF
jgi:hypothetical protein